jgi:hypothetical protein
MFSENERLVVREDHGLHANRVGYFQFVSGPDQDLVVLASDPEGFAPSKWRSRNYFSVKITDIKQ